VTAPGFYDGIKHSNYLADADGPRLSASLAHLMLSKSPRHAWAAHPLLGNLRVDDRTEERDRGTLLHSLLLGSGPQIEVVEADSWRTNAAKEQRAAAEEAGSVAVLEATYEAAMETSAAINEGLRDVGINGGFRTERTAIWEQDGVQCRARLDMHSINFPGQLFDLKILRSANPAIFGRTMLAYGYDVQHAAYVSAVEHLIPELAGRVRMEFLLCEPFPPYAVCRVRPAGSMRSLGSSKWARAVKLWGECLSSGKWPGYGVAEVEAPAWANSEELSAAVSAAGEESWISEGGE
jgi:hypothetical protein